MFNLSRARKLLQLSLIFPAALSLGMLATGGCVTACAPAKAAPGIFTGSKPRTDADFRLLQTKGIRTILNVETLYSHVEPERRLAWQYGFDFRSVPIFPSPLQPREQRVKEALLIISDRSLHPVFVHCLVGEDRATFLVALYRIYYENWQPEEAWREMLRAGFHDNWWLHGFRTYFWSHTHKPDWVQKKALSETRRTPACKSIGHSEIVACCP